MQQITNTELVVNVFGESLLARAHEVIEQIVKMSAAHESPVGALRSHAMSAIRSLSVEKRTYRGHGETMQLTEAHLVA